MVMPPIQVLSLNITKKNKSDKSEYNDEWADKGIRTQYKIYFTRKAL